MKAIMTTDNEHCLFCFANNPEMHHIFFGTSNRAVSDKHGLLVPLCHKHHRTDVNSPHRNRIIDLALKCWAQSTYEKEIGDRDSFRREFGKSYL